MNDKRERQFVDTNVLVYAHDSSAGNKNIVAKTLVSNLWQLETGCTSIQVLQEFYITVTKKVKKPVRPEVAQKIISDLSKWVIHSPSSRDILDSIDIQQRYNISFWDSLIICSAQKLGCSVIWSEDLNHGQSYGEVIVKNPFKQESF
jgi:predicted nucleic acid-binding protein